jgi:hypothetical protein
LPAPAAASNAVHPRSDQIRAPRRHGPGRWKSIGDPDGRFAAFFEDMPRAPGYWQA